MIDRLTGPAPGPTPDLAAADILLINTSGGKDSQVLLDEVTRLAEANPRTDPNEPPRWTVAVHCDLGPVEWDGTPELAAEQVTHYPGVRFEIVKRDLGHLLIQVADRRIALDKKSEKYRAEAAATTDPAEKAELLKKAETAYNAAAFPSSKARFCTSDQKTSQVAKLMTQLVDEYRAAYGITRPVRIINTLGIRAAESPTRAKKSPLGPDVASNGKREVTRWLPIFHWTDDDVWARIKETGIRYHKAYDLGMSRLSCAFCVFASKADLKISARHNRALAEEYVALEELTRSRFTMAHSMAEILAEVDAEDAAGVVPITPAPRIRRIPIALAAA